ncbi:hypothetical protein [Nonomuraea sp. bgisy101]|uniref:hypothetical protein n=1 Tax=Nonomuraea sp. bgisy101 TaxID=3413784 RepID=UPI003D761B6B
MTPAPVPTLPLVDGILAVLRAAVPEDVVVGCAGVPPGTEPPYVVLYPDTGNEARAEETLDGATPTDLYYQLTCVGSGPEQAIWLANLTTIALLTTMPTVAGQRPRLALREGSQPVQRDDDAGGVYIATAQYLTRTQPL